MDGEGVVPLGREGKGREGKGAEANSEYNSEYTMM